MVQTLNHRGPDANGCYISPKGNCGLGHARLSIIDLAGGSQPMCNEDGSIWISFNGECYNFPALKESLQAQGHCFKSHSDTEVIIHLYEQYGTSCLEHLRGMFAFAIWDENKQQLFIARDRLGQKPLFYSHDKDNFIFGSECKAILTNRPELARINYDNIGKYLLLGYLDETDTGFQNITKLQPGHFMTINADGSTTGQKQYWQLPTERDYTGSYQQAVEAVRNTVIESVKLRMISDVPLGSFLSGGIDSTIITGVMAQLSDTPIKTCSIGFAEQLYDESTYSHLAAKRFNCDHKSYTAKPNCVETIHKLIEYYDEPFADCSAIPTYHLCKVTRQRVTVALSGDGGDECFAGYQRHKAIYFAASIYKNAILRTIASSGLWQRVPSSDHHSKIQYIKRFLNSAYLPTETCYLNWLGIFDLDLIKKTLQHTTNIKTPKHISIFRQNGVLPSEAALYFDSRSYLPDDLNVKTDRASMAHSLEVRSPFQDHKVMELAYSLPLQWLTGCKNGKKILRDAFKDILPEQIATRKKMGFGVPVGQWFKNELKELYFDNVINGELVKSEIINQQFAQKLFDDNSNGIYDYGQHMWALLTLQLWATKWVK